jgi:rod shape determining protein RodA
MNNFLNTFKKLDYILLIPVLIISFFSLATLSSFDSNNTFFYKQIVWIIIGITCFLFISKIDFSFLKNTKSVVIFYCITNLLLGSTLLFGSAIKGSKAWLDFGFFSLQPVDFVKLALIILLAKYFSKRHVEIKYARHIIVSFLYTALPVGITLLQPDFGSAMVMLLIWFVMVAISGLSKKHFGAMCVMSVITICILWVSVFKPYQKERVLTFLDPLRDIRGSGYNVFQSEIAIGSGGLLGKGVGYGTQSRLNFLPEYRTDFIFAAYAEEWGLVGSIILCALILTILLRILYISQNQNDSFLSLIAIGVFAWIFVHSTINIGMNMGVMPVTGIPLPFMSYGGSHFISGCISLGIVASFNFNKFNIRKSYKNEFLGLE